MDKGHDEEESLPLAQQAVAGRNGVPPTGDQKKPAPRDAGWVNARLLPRGRRSLAGGYSSSRLRRYVKVRNETGADRKSTRLKLSHSCETSIPSYTCTKKTKIKQKIK